MHINTRNMEEWLKLNRVFDLALIVNASWIMAILPKWISNRTGLEIKAAWLLVFIGYMFICNGALNIHKHLYLRSYNDQAEKEVYLLQQAFKKHMEVSSEDLKLMVEILSTINDAMPPGTNEQKKDK